MRASPQPVVRDPVLRPVVRPASFEDYEQVAPLLSSNALTVMSCEAWAGIWKHNPVYRTLQGQWPIGWVLEAGAGEIVGFIANIPVAYRFRRRELRGSVTGSWVTQAGYRGYSMALMSAVMKQRGVDLFVTNTASAASDATLRMMRWSRVPAGAWDKSHFWITGCRAFSKWALEEKRAPLPGLMATPLSLAFSSWNLWAARFLRTRALRGAVELCSTFDGRFDEFWEELEARSPEVLLAVRSRETLLWHFGRSLKQGSARILTLTRASKMIAYAIFDRRDARKLKRVRLVDFQALEDKAAALGSFLEWMLREGSASGAHVLESAGWPLGPLGDPDCVAPYRRALESWRYYYKATGDDLRQALADPSAWAPSYYDGDASL